MTAAAAAATASAQLSGGCGLVRGGCGGTARLAEAGADSATVVLPCTRLRLVAPSALPAGLDVLPVMVMLAFGSHLEGIEVARDWHAMRLLTKSWLVHWFVLRSVLFCSCLVDPNGRW